MGRAMFRSERVQYWLNFSFVAELLNVFSNSERWIGYQLQIGKDVEGMMAKYKFTSNLVEGLRKIDKTSDRITNLRA
jgi:hypothetical protein